MLKYALLAVSAALLALLVTPCVRMLAVWLDAVDEPGGRRIHEERVPRLGGVAVGAALFGAVGIGVAVDWTFFDVFLGHGWDWIWLLAGAVVVVGAGVADDVWHLGAVPKLAFQVLAGGMVLAGASGIHALSNPFTGGTVELGWLSVPITVLWVVGITNAFNLIDGLDGLAAGTALIASGTIFLLSLGGGRVDVALLSATLAGALAGFLCYNFNPASIFLGDSGSLLLGYLLAVLSIQSAHKGPTAVVLLVPILALGLPIMDTLLAMARRVMRALRVVQLDPERNEYRLFVVGSTSVFRADRDHIHHRLVAMGLTHRHAVLLLYGVCVALSAVALVAVTAKGPTTALLVAVVAAAVFVAIRKLGYHEVEVLRRGTLLPLFDLPVLNRRLFHAVMDASFIAAAYTCAFVVAYAGSLTPAARNYLLQTLAIVVAIKLAVFLYTGFYQRAYRQTDAADLLGLAKSLMLAQVAAVAVLALLYRLPAHWVVLFVLDAYFTGTVVAGARLSFKFLEVAARERSGPGAQPVLIYGAGNSGTALLHEIGQNRALRRRAVGFVDDTPALWGRQVNGVPVLGGGEKLHDAIERSGAREVVVASSKVPAERLRTMAAACAARGVVLRQFRLVLDEVPAPAASPQPQMAAAPVAEASAAAVRASGKGDEAVVLK